MNELNIEFDEFLSKQVDIEARKQKQSDFGWNKRESCMQLFKLVILYLQNLRAKQHRKFGLQIAEGINSLTDKLIDEGWHNRALSFKKLVKVCKA